MKNVSSLLLITQNEIRLWYCAEFYWGNNSPVLVALCCMNRLGECIFAESKVLHQLLAFMEPILRCNCYWKWGSVALWVKRDLSSTFSLILWNVIKVTGWTLQNIVARLGFPFICVCSIVCFGWLLRIFLLWSKLVKFQQYHNQVNPNFKMLTASNTLCSLSAITNKSSKTV